MTGPVPTWWCTPDDESVMGIELFHHCILNALHTVSKDQFLSQNSQTILIHFSKKIRHQNWLFFYFFLNLSFWTCYAVHSVLKYQFLSQKSQVNFDQFQLKKSQIASKSKLTIFQVLCWFEFLDKNWWFDTLCIAQCVEMSILVIKFTEHFYQL